MTKPLTVEQRVKIAEACEPMPSERAWYSDGEDVWSGVPYGIHVRWNPGEKYYQWQALVSTVARMILALDIETDAYEYQDFQDRYIEAIATNDVNAIEMLLLELIQESKE